MPRVVVLGAGIGGVPMAFELRERLGRKAEIDVVSESEWFQFVPSNPWVAVGRRKPEDVKVHLPPVFAKLGIGFHSCGARQVRPDRNEVLLNDGRALAYDYLVIATGPKLAFDEIEGFGPPRADDVRLARRPEAARYALAVIEVQIALDQDARMRSAFRSGDTSARDCERRDNDQPFHWGLLSLAPLLVLPPHATAACRPYYR
jgi:NADPH-dependent 2,4-dienoyl-CoA reductase/sulfur reductase-like enzyme